jgi:hypothetical protein
MGGLVGGLGAAVVLLALVSAGAGVWQAMSDSDEPTAATTGPSTTAGSPSAQSPQPDDGDTAGGCVVELAAAEDVIDVARSGIDHWRGHIAASRDWEEGRITEQRKKEIWKATRLAGPEDVEKYEAVLADYAEVKGGCAGPPPGTAAGCVDRWAAVRESLEAAADAMGDWEWHQQQMSDFADGRFDAEHANMMWEEAKRIAPENLGRFADAEDSLAEAPTCP